MAFFWLLPLKQMRCLPLMTFWLFFGPLPVAIDLPPWNPTNPTTLKPRTPETLKPQTRHAHEPCFLWKRRQPSAGDVFTKKNTNYIVCPATVVCLFFFSCSLFGVVEWFSCVCLCFSILNLAKMSVSMLANIFNDHPKCLGLGETWFGRSTLPKPTLAILIWPTLAKPTLAIPTLAKKIWPTLADLNCPTLAKKWVTDFGQTDFGKPTLAKIGVFVFGPSQ